MIRMNGLREETINPFMVGVGPLSLGLVPLVPTLIWC